MSGRAACNRIVGAYTESAGRVSFTMLAFTKMFCLDAPFSDAFVAALDEATSYAIDADRLSITLASSRRAVAIGILAGVRSGTYIHRGGTVRLRLWGVRGSIPVPGPNTVRYGGNTACLELRYGPDDTLIIVDAGSGIKPLGDAVVRSDLKKGPIRAKLFLSHTHWDHIIGFPFFVPIFIPGTELDIHSPRNYEDRSVEEILGIQLSYQYFPVRQSELSATIRYHSLREEVMELDDGMKITTKFLNHPVSTLGYRFDYEGHSIVTLFDHEPFRNVFPTDPDAEGYDEAAAHEGAEVAEQENARIRAFIAGADVVIHDSQYTQVEYDEKFTGWGHSTYEFAIQQAHKSRVKRLFFYHHDPLRTDDQLDELIATYRAKVEGKTSMRIEMAREGDVIEPDGA